jgi:hypothetical protein
MPGLVPELTGAEDAAVLSNNAAAVLIVLNTLSAGKDDIVFRGELIEIGSSFRLPEMMARAGAKLVEVGTTNRSHPHDYAAIGESTAVLMQVHTSNFFIQGLYQSGTDHELATLARARNIPLTDLGAYGLGRNPQYKQRSLRAPISTLSQATSFWAAHNAASSPAERILLRRLRAEARVASRQSPPGDARRDAETLPRPSAATQHVTDTQTFSSCHRRHHSASRATGDAYAQRRRS